VARRSTAVTIPISYLTNNKALKRSGSLFGKFSRGVGRSAGVAVAAIAAIGGAAARMAAEFETSFAKIEGLVGVSGQALGKLEEAAQTLGPQFGKSANEAADALFFITSAGLRGAAATEVLEASLKGAAIGLGETKTIADLATSAVNAYGQQNLNGAQAVDVLTEAVRLGKLEPAELAQSMGQVLPISSNLGVSFQEVGAAMAGMSKTGTDASTAATQLRQILNTIAKPTSQANEQLASMGMSAEGLRKQIREEGLFATLETLTTAFDGNIEATTQVFGNIRALSGVLDLMGASVDDNRELFRQMTDDVGVLDEALQVTEQTASFKFNRAMEGVKASLIPVGTTLLEVGSQLLDGLMPIIDQMGPVMEETFALMVPPLLDLVETLPKVFEGFSPLFPVLGEITALVLQLVESLLPPFVAFMEFLAPIVTFLAEAFTTLVQPLVDQFAPVLQRLFEVLTPLVESLFPILLILVDALLEPFMNLLEVILPFIELGLIVLTDVINQFVVPALEVFAQFLDTRLPDAIAFLSRHGLAPGLLAFGDFAADYKNVANGLEIFVAETFNNIIAAVEASVRSVVRATKSFANILKRSPDPASRLLGMALDQLPDPESINLQRVKVPEMKFSFPEVDVTGITDSARRTMEAIESQRSATAGIGVPEQMDVAARIQAGLSTPGLFQRKGITGLFGGDLPSPTVPFQAFAKGGIVTQPTFGLIGEAGPEAVIPLNQAGRMGTTINVTVNAGMGTDGGRVGEEIVKHIRRYERTSGPVFVRA